jgi:hypothetical protein
VTAARWLATAARRETRLVARLGALGTGQRRGHNKATVALANKMARIVWATRKYQRLGFRSPAHNAECFKTI